MPRKYNLPKLNQEEIENLNRPITSNEIESVIKKIPNKQKPRTRWLPGQLYHVCMYVCMYVCIHSYLHSLSAKFISQSMHKWRHNRVFQHVTFVQKNTRNSYVRMIISAFYIKELVYRKSF